MRVILRAYAEGRAIKTPAVLPAGGGKGGWNGPFESGRRPFDPVDQTMYSTRQTRLE